MHEYIWLSYPIGIGDPRPPAIPAPELSDLYTVGEDGANVQILRIASHTGTHLDTPRHVVSDGICITDFSPAELIFSKPALIELRLEAAEIVMPERLEPEKAGLQAADLGIFRFDWGRYRRSEPARYSARSPGFGTESAAWIRENCPNLRAVGFDVPSVATIAHLDTTMKAHDILLEGTGRRFLIFEEMNLEHDLKGLLEVRVGPWLVQGMDSGPCSIIGVLEKP